MASRNCVIAEELLRKSTRTKGFSPKPVQQPSPGMPPGETGSRRILVPTCESCDRDQRHQGCAAPEMAWGPRKIVTARQLPRICSRMIPVCSPSDSVLFTPKVPATASHRNFSRSPHDLDASARWGAGWRAGERWLLSETRQRLLAGLATVLAEYEMWLRVRERRKSRALNEGGATCMEIEVLPQEFSAYCMGMKRPDFSIAALDRCARAKALARGARGR
jgi:hypothetical protein